MRFYSLFWYICIISLIIFGFITLFSEKQSLSLLRTIFFGIAPVIISIIFLLLRKNKSLIIILSNSIILCFIGFCFFEIYLINRNVIDEIIPNEDFNKKNVCGNSLKNINNLKIYPIGGISKKEIQFINSENFSYSFKDNDRYGFNNNDEVWDKRKIHSIFLGDSFAHGADVNLNENFVELYKKKFNPTINLACGGNGPLIAYAAMIEYIVKSKLKPKYLIWVYYSGNDLSELDTEYSSFYKNYLTKDFHQNLLTRQSEIDDVLNKYLDKNIDFWKENAKIIIKNKKINFKDFYKFRKIRESIGFRHAYEKINFEIFKKIIKSTNKHVHDWGGELIFVIIPGEERYLNFIHYYDQFYYEEPIKKYLKGEQIRIIDLNKKLIKSKNPRDYYHGHLNIDGHILLYKEIINAINP